MMKARITFTDPTALDDANASPIPEGDFAFVQLQRSLDNGQSYQIVGHVPPGTGVIEDDLTGVAPGPVNYKLNAVDTQSVALTGPDSKIVQVTIEEPEHAAIAAPTDVVASIVE